tara:strand:+ start:25 stop:462 length:438 start_codon:yes stop_codon:yes gene_type:complete
MKKAQTEIIGLVVIVILFIVIAVIFVKLSTAPKSKSVIKESVEVSNLLNAVVKLTPCKEDKELSSLSDIIAECENQQYCNENCKEYIEKQVNNVMSSALDKKKSYNMIITKRGDTFIEQGDCKGDTVFADTIILPSFAAKLEICN